MTIQFKAEYEDARLYFDHCVKTPQQVRDYPLHYHTKYEFLFLKAGSVSYLIDDQVFPLPANTLVITRPNRLHGIRLDGDAAYERYDLLVSESQLSQSSLVKIPADLHVLRFDDNPLVIRLFEKMDHYCALLRGEELGDILCALLREVVLNVGLRLGSRQEEAEMHPLTRKAAQYIETHLEQIRDVDEICQALAISKSYLYKLFWKDLGTSPKQYVTGMRLNRARRDILLGAKATAVFSQYGFSDYSSFFRAYKKHFGYSPAVTQQSALVRTPGQG